ncbi:MAG: ABC transporter permease [Proteobacteria bacterium]|nr:ABC transporter permease [Pseudomonadota bacterium]
MFSQTKLTFRIALQFMRRRNSKLPSFSAAVSVVGVALGVAAFLVVVTVFNSFEKELKNILLAANPNIVVYSLPNGIPDAAELAARIQRTHEGEIERVSRFQYSEALLSFGPQTATAVIRGIEGVKASTADKLSRFVQPADAISTLNSHALRTPLEHQLAEELGDKEAVADPLSQDSKPQTLPSLVVGKGLALRLNASVGDVVTLITSSGKSGEETRSSSRYQEFKISGIMNVGLAQYDDRIAFLNFQDAVSLFGIRGWATGLEIRVKDPNIALSLARTLRKSHPYRIQAWQEIDKSLFEQIDRDGMAIKLIVLIIALVAAFNIIVTLSLSVLDRSKQIAILRSTGATRLFIVRVFVAQGVTLGLVGSMVGVGLGLLVLKIFSGFDIGDLKAFYFLEKIPVEYDLPLIAFAVIVALVLSFASALYPAYRATRVSPLLGLRPGGMNQT